MIDPAKVLAGIPAGLRSPLLKSYEEIAKNFAEHKWEPSELNGGKFSEVVYTIILGALNGNFPAKASKPTDMVASCRALEKITPDPNRAGDRSFRILIPRVLTALYEIRNNRGVGHIGGDVDPNFLDASAVYGMSSWVLAELVRIFHTVTIQEAQETVDVLVERTYPLVWVFGDTRRVLDPKMSKGDQSLLLLHGKAGWVPADDLIRWVEYSNPNVFKAKVLRPLHKARAIEFDEANQRVRISALGVSEVETRILKTRK